MLKEFLQKIGIGKSNISQTNRLVSSRIFSMEGGPISSDNRIINSTFGENVGDKPTEPPVEVKTE